VQLLWKQQLRKLRSNCGGQLQQLQQLRQLHAR
jgi:hypothetical protein